MTLRINGKPREEEGPLSAADLLARLGVDTARTVVELNGRVLERMNLPSEMLKEGDVLEIIRFVGGG